MHSVQGGAGIFDLVNVSDLARRTEDTLALIRSRKMIPTPERVRVLLNATGQLRELIQDPEVNNHIDITRVMSALSRLLTENREGSVNGTISVIRQERRSGRQLRMLLAEDDFASRLMLQSFLSRYGECHAATNGKEAVDTVRFGLERGQRYDLICMTS